MQEKDNLCRPASKCRINPARLVQIQRRGNFRRPFDAGPCTSAGRHPAQNQRVEFYGVSERENLSDDF